jgi:hypothetical protein
MSSMLYPREGGFRSLTNEEEIDFEENPSADPIVSGGGNAASYLDSQ